MVDETPTDGSPDSNQANNPLENESEWWLDRPASISLIIRVLMAACAIVVFADFFYHKHADYSFQEWIAFDAVFGFVAYVGLVTTAKGIRRILMRDEDYYD